MEKRLTRAKAIRAKCIDCCCGHRRDVKLCYKQDCPLWKFRMGYEMGYDGKKIVRRKKKEDGKDE